MRCIIIYISLGITVRSYTALTQEFVEVACRPSHDRYRICFYAWVSYVFGCAAYLLNFSEELKLDANFLSQITKRLIIRRIFACIPKHTPALALLFPPIPHWRSYKTHV